MRTYPRNSPQAAARLIALALIADGHVCRSEFDALQRDGTESRLGLRHGELAEVLQTFCEDLLHVAQPHQGLASCLDDDLIASLLAEVDDPELQRQVTSAIVAAVAADGHLSDGEKYVMDAMLRAWRGMEEVVMG